MRSFMLSLAIAMLAVPATSPALADPGGHGHHGDHGDHGGRGDHGDHGGRGDHGDHGDRHDNGRHNGWDNGRGNEWQNGRHYDWNRPDPRYGGYDPSRYYRSGSYGERRLARYDRIYRGSDGRYYCRRSDGTTGLIVGGVLGGLFGNAISSGHSSTLATLLGAGGGALLGRSIDRGNVRCR